MVKMIVPVCWGVGGDIGEGAGEADGVGDEVEGGGPVVEGVDDAEVLAVHDAEGVAGGDGRDGAVELEDFDLVGEGALSCGDGVARVDDGDDGRRRGLR